MRNFWSANELEFFSEKELSKIIPLSHSTFVRMRKKECAHSLPFFKIGGKFLYQKADVVNWLNKKVIK